MTLPMDSHLKPQSCFGMGEGRNDGKSSKCNRMMATQLNQLMAWTCDGVINGSCSQPLPWFIASDRSLASCQLARRTDREIRTFDMFIGLGCNLTNSKEQFEWFYGFLVTVHCMASSRQWRIFNFRPRLAALKHSQVRSEERLLISVSRSKCFAAAVKVKLSGRPFLISFVLTLHSLADTRWNHPYLNFPVSIMGPLSFTTRAPS